MKKGFLWPNDAPGWGMEVDEKLAAKNATSVADTTRQFSYSWGTTRRRDGSIVRP
ncbi:MAG: hypothetical protein R2748_17135 [Bryobacterales bacterium]